MDSLKGAKLIKADGTTVEADSVLADKVKHKQTKSYSCYGPH